MPLLTDINGRISANYMGGSTTGQQGQQVAPAPAPTTSRAAVMPGPAAPAPGVSVAPLASAGPAAPGTQARATTAPAPVAAPAPAPAARTPAEEAAYRERVARRAAAGQTPAPAPAPRPLMPPAPAPGPNQGANFNFTNRVGQIIQADSPLMQIAQTRATQQANQRGLRDSSLAVQAGQQAVQEAAMQMAGQEQQQAIAQMDADNRRTLIELEAAYKTQISSNENIANAWGTLQNQISELQNNPDLNPDTKRQLINNAIASFQSFTRFWQSSAGTMTDISALLNFGVTNTGQGMATRTGGGGYAPPAPTQIDPRTGQPYSPLGGNLTDQYSQGG